MSKRRRVSAKTMPTKRRVRTRSRKTLPATLPPQAPAETSTLPVRVERKHEYGVLPPNSMVRRKVLAIIAMRLEGKNNEEIGKLLDIKPASVNQYMYLAGKNGWLKNRAIDPSDRLDHEVAHKVVRNLDEALDSPDEERRDKATKIVAEGMLFKRYNEQAQQAPPNLMIGVRIEMPNTPGTPAPTIREGTTGGEPLWREGEVVNGPEH